jgi:hypothetical protein
MIRIGGNAADRTSCAGAELVMSSAAGSKSKRYTSVFLCILFTMKLSYYTSGGECTTCGKG